MGKRNDLPKTLEGMKKYLKAALDRVIAGTPNNPDLIALARKRRLKVNITNVTKEAGVSRTLIGFEDCRYPSIREEILGIKLPVRTKTDMRSVNADMRAHNKKLENQLEMSLSEQAALLIRISRMASQFDDKMEEHKRIQERGSRRPNEVADLKVVKSEKKTQK